RPERLEPGSVLSSANGDVTVAAARPHQHRWIVQFEGVTGREGAEALRDLVLSAEPLDEPDALWVHQLVGADVVDVGGTRLGSVVSVEANPASDLLVLDTGGLVPLTFVVTHEPGRVVVDPPEGLLP